jgi:hypothetical protein
MRKSTRRRWFEYAGCIFLGASVLFALHDLVRAFIIQSVQFPIPVFRLWIARAEQPLFFHATLVLLVVCIVVSSFFLYVVCIGLNAERNYFRRRDTRPPLDDAVREALDRTP